MHTVGAVALKAWAHGAVCW